MRKTIKKQTKKTAKTPKTPKKKSPVKKPTKRASDIRVLKNRVEKYKGNLIYGLKHIFDLDEDVQHFILFHLTANDTMYSQYTNAHINKYLVALETDSEFYDSEKEKNEMLPFEVEQVGETQELWDYQITPMIRGKILSGLQELVTGGGMKKWVKVLNEVSNIHYKGKYQ
jgi:hypothetical protein